MNRKVARLWISVAFITLVGVGVRLLIVAAASFPINDGGLFYAFTADVLGNGLRLPTFSAYNAASIPFVYPPLAFYLTAILHLVTDISVLRILQFAPAIMSSAAIPVFFAFAAKSMRSQRQAVLATVVLCLTPRSFDWLIMGGGITRSLGLLFFLLFVWQVWRLFAAGEAQALAPAIFAGALTVLSHPEAAVHAALAGGLILLWHRRTRSGMGHGLVLALGICALTAPWWFTVVVRHGIAPWQAGFTAAQEDGHNLLFRLIALIRFDFTDEPFLRIFGVLGLLGLLVQLARGEYYLTTWVVLIAVAEPRGGALFMMVPLTMAAGSFLDTVLFPALMPQSFPISMSVEDALPAGASPHTDLLISGAPTVVLVFLVVYGVFSSYFVGRQLEQRATLGRRDIAALQWVASYGVPSDTYALVTEGEPLLDPTSDWFPAITGRRAVASHFGSEWRTDVDFARALLRYRALQNCSNQEAQCLRDWLESAGEPVDLIYVRAPESGGRTLLQESLRKDNDFRLLYSADGIEIFDRRPSPGS